MDRREFLKQSLMISTTLSARTAACDPHHADIRVIDSSDRSGAAHLIPLPAGQTVIRRYTLFNGGPAGARLLVRVQPRLRPGRGKTLPLPSITRATTVPANGQTVLPVTIALPMVPVNTLLELTVTVTQEGTERGKTTDSFLLVPPGIRGTQAVFLDRDDQTQGNWRTTYGKQAFFLPIRTGTASFSGGAVALDRGLETEPKASGVEHPILSDDVDVGLAQKAFEVFDKAMTVTDPRIPFGGNGLTTRDPIAFSTQPHYGLNPKTHVSRLVTTPILLRVDCADDQPHRLSLYFVDYNRSGRSVDVALYDRQSHLLVSERLANYREGTFLRFRFVGSPIVLITSLTKENPTLSGAFVDPDTRAGLLNGSTPRHL